jgi:hypothetical protein
MTKFTVYFRSDSETASEEFDADTPQQALALARKAYEDDPSSLWFEPYDGAGPVNEIAVCGSDDDELVVWQDDDLRLRLAASDLLEAAEKVVARWERGDLAEAVRGLAGAIAKAKEGAG